MLYLNNKNHCFLPEEYLIGTKNWGNYCIVAGYINCGFILENFTKSI